MATVTASEIDAIHLDASGDPIVFPGPRKNFLAAVALTAAGGLAFSMGLTITFFAEATAWVFLSWGILLFYSNLLEMNETYIIDAQGLTIFNPFRLWRVKQVWPWAAVNRVDAVVRRVDPNLEGVQMQVYCASQDPLDPGATLRSDTAYRPELAALIVEKAGLKGGLEDFAAVPDVHPATYTWS